MPTTLFNITDNDNDSCCRFVLITRCDNDEDGEDDDDNSEDNHDDEDWQFSGSTCFILYLTLLLSTGQDFCVI